MNRVLGRQMVPAMAITAELQGQWEWEWAIGTMVMAMRWTTMRVGLKWGGSGPIRRVIHGD